MSGWKGNTTTPRRINPFAPYIPYGMSSFFGGMSVDQKIGSVAQFYYGRHVDFRKKPSQCTVLPGTVNATSGTVTDLVQDMTQAPTGVRYALGDTGNAYKVATNGTWSLLGAIGENGAAGILQRDDVDMTYIAGATGISRIKNVSTAPQLEKGWFQRGRTTTSTCYKSGGINTYTPKLTLSENASDVRTFITDIEPIYSIKVFVGAKGTGNWTLTLHDDANNSLGTVTVTTTNLKSNQLNEFVFSAPVRALVSPNGRTYHFHLTSTVADGTIATTTANSLADCDMELWANALVTTQNGLHPIFSFTNLTLIGNGRYVAAYEPLQDQPTTADFSRHRLTLPPGFEVCGFAQKNLLCIIGAEKRSSTGEFQEGALFFWDGTATTYNDWWPVPEGSPESLFSHKNTAYFFAGGALYRIQGTDQPSKVRTMRGTDSEFSNISDSTHVNPHMMTVRRGVLLMGYPTQTTNQVLEHGIYSMGSTSREYPDSFGYSYTTSNGSILNNGSNNLRIGMIKSYGDTLYVSWRDDSTTSQHYGVDVVNNSSAPSSDFQLQSLYFDQGIPFKQKKAGKVICTFTALPSDCQVRTKYRIDGGAWVYSDYATNGQTYIVQAIEKMFFGIEFGIEGVVGTTTPEIQSLYLFYDPLMLERELG